MRRTTLALAAAMMAVCARAEASPVTFTLIDGTYNTIAMDAGARNGTSLSGFQLTIDSAAVARGTFLLRSINANGSTYIQAMCVGTVTTLLARPEHERDPQLSAAALDAMLAAVVNGFTKEEDSPVATLAVGLRSHVDAILALTPGERLLMTELLERLSSQH